MTSTQELIKLKNIFLALQKQLINLKQFDLYINEIETICNSIDRIDLLTIAQIEEIEKNTKLTYNIIFNDLNISVQFKRNFLQIIKTYLNTLISLSVVKIYNSI